MASTHRIVRPRVHSQCCSYQAQHGLSRYQNLVLKWSTQSHVQDQEGRSYLWLGSSLLTFIYPGFDCGSLDFYACLAPVYRCLHPESCKCTSTARPSRTPAKKALITREACFTWPAFAQAMAFLRGVQNCRSRRSPFGRGATATLRQPGQLQLPTSPNSFTNTPPTAPASPATGFPSCPPKIAHANISKPPRHLGHSGL